MRIVRTPSRRRSGSTSRRSCPRHRIPHRRHASTAWAARGRAGCRSGTAASGRFHVTMRRSTRWRTTAATRPNTIGTPSAVVNDTALLRAVEKCVETGRRRVDNPVRADRCALDHIGADDARWLRRGGGRLKRGTEIAKRCGVVLEEPQRIAKRRRRRSARRRSCVARERPILQKRFGARAEVPRRALASHLGRSRKFRS